MTRIIRELAEISDRYDVLFCDLWGCVHDGKRAMPAAVAALQAFRAKGGAVVLLTNAPRPKPSVMRQIERLGVPADAWDDIVTSGDAAQYALVNGAVGRKVWHVGPPKDLTFFSEMAPDLPAADIELVPLTEAEGIVATDLFDNLHEQPDEYYGRLLMAREAGLPMLCANPDLMVDYGDKRVWCAGALAKMYEEMGGTALYFGKPHPPIYDLARRRLAAAGREVSEDRILCLGDGIGTDVAGAAGEGLDGLFVTGGLAAEQFGPDVENPDAALLDAWLAAHVAAPKWAIGRLR
ncbi:TIGR01459 family HAD-type hydrolase [Gemmobacter nectariphilus]|uniref:TIGR01459 family HAD-type hydrolase n=1 Tax=Gemmobacter nectariphilus TaxID=220343 RepID=UPI0004186AA1|nr:TIGR01459 family HAD-type hydrolase [Gemmobacter nectariphilus]